MNRKLFPPLLLCLATLIVLSPAAARAASSRWISVGPEGGDARAFASSPRDPHHLYLGTTNSWIYQSVDDGATWTRLAELGNVDDLVVDNLMVDEADPKTLYAGVWQMDQTNGGIYVTHDGGHTWASIPDMQGKSVRSLAQAPSDPKILIAGAIEGVFRSEDNGLHWKQISPEGSGEIHKVESIAIDPTDPHTIYAGTWHLPWKTTDGGATWHNIKEGLIDDSDVFSILLDPKFPSTVYLSACSGIYKSDTAGEQFRKIQGIPSTARRTRVLMQDPVNRNVVYAGTTEGLYKTEDAGTNWKRMTGPDLIINDIYVDPSNPQRVLLATDRSGVLASNDAGVSFASSNDGISQRQVTALLVDTKNPETMYAGVVNDKSYGGVFVTGDGGKSWTQRSQGLDGRDVFSLAQADDGTIFAGTNDGLFRLNGSVWVPDNKVVNVKVRTVYVIRHHKKEKKTIPEGSKQSLINSQVSDLSMNGAVWFVATADGVYRSTTQGATWTGPVLTEQHYRFVDAHGNIVFAAQREALHLSQDGGEHWSPIMLPSGLTSVTALTTTPSGVLWVGGRQGAYYSEDQGQTWHAISELPVRAIDNIDYDAALGRVVITSHDSDLVFAINSDNKSWKWWDAGWKVRMVHSMNGRLIGASLYDGVVVQPKADGVASEAARQ
ncbi:MAG: transcriptional regulator [Silvibacterium sp.]